MRRNKPRQKVFAQMQAVACSSKDKTMTRFKTTMIGLTLVFALAACAEMSYAPVKYSNGLMTGTNGMTLYTFDKDVAGSGKSVCNGPCATNWPPFMAGADSKNGGDWTVVTRDDGSKQWAYSGKPLYYWSKDEKPGDTKGDGFNNAWRAVKPEPRPLTGNMNC
jgi:predicted lipoprotein with Yx(FWY)xxD motif